MSAPRCRRAMIGRIAANSAAANKIGAVSSGTPTAAAFGI